MAARRSIGNVAHSRLLKTLPTGRSSDPPEVGARAATALAAPPRRRVTGSVLADRPDWRVVSDKELFGLLLGLVAVMMAVTTFVLVL